MNDGVCDNQTEFNDAFHEAAEHNRRENMKFKPIKAIGAILYLFFLFWAVSIALKVPREHRVIHVVLALVFPPAYILAHYLSNKNI